MISNLLCSVSFPKISEMECSHPLLSNLSSTMLPLLNKDKPKLHKLKPRHKSKHNHSQLQMHSNLTLNLLLQTMRKQRVKKAKRVRQIM